VSDEAASLLREIRDNQREALAMQRDAIAVQREHVTLYRAQHHRWMRMTRVVIWILIPALILLMATILWPYVRWLLWRIAT